MAEIMAFNNRKLNIEELEKERGKASVELHALNNRIQMGYKPKTQEDAAAMLETMFAPSRLRKEIAQAKGNAYKTPFEEIGEKMETFSEKEIESGMIIVK